MCACGNCDLFLVTLPSLGRSYVTLILRYTIKQLAFQYSYLSLPMFLCFISVAVTFSLALV